VADDTVARKTAKLHNRPKCCHFFDVEREFSYLKIRFGQDYETLDREDLDNVRMVFYTLCIRVSAAYGHDQLYWKGFPDPAMLRSIYVWISGYSWKSPWAEH
jgi:hypothetical protein